MKANDIFDVLGGIVLVALVTTIVSHRESARAITAAANGFAGIISSALGK